MKFFQDVFNGIVSLVTPPKAWSWKTLILLSLFSWIMSYLAENDGWVQRILSFFAWIFLITGVAWATSKNKIVISGVPVGAWFTGALVSLFIFGSRSEGVSPSSLVWWPTISALIAASPEFVGSGKARIPPPDKRQQLILLIGINMVISCWLQVHFVIQNWLQEYPSVLTDNFNRSALIIRLEQTGTIPANGVLILDRMEQAVREELNEQPWSQAERWLIEAQQRVQELSKQIIQESLSNVEERTLWRVDALVSSIQSGYDLQLLAIWDGPSSDPNKYYLSKSCNITQVAGDTEQPTATFASVTCEPVSSKTPGPPPR